MPPGCQHRLHELPNRKFIVGVTGKPVLVATGRIVLSRTVVDGAVRVWRSPYPESASGRRRGPRKGRPVIGLMAWGVMEPVGWEPSQTLRSRARGIPKHMLEGHFQVQGQLEGEVEEQIYPLELLELVGLVGVSVWLLEMPLRSPDRLRKGMDLPKNLPPRHLPGRHQPRYRWRLPSALVFI